MAESSQAYHARRAAAERARAEQCDDMSVARAHRELAELHEAQAAGRPVQHMALHLA